MCEKDSLYYAGLNRNCESPNTGNDTDNSVQSNWTYYYVVTALNSSDQESAYSSEVTAIVP
jgi:hypothetical protein